MVVRSGTRISLAVLALCSLAVKQADAISFDRLVASFDVLETVAGTGLIPDKGVNGWRSDMEGGLAVNAELSRPHMAMADVAGNIYIADKDAHAIRRVTPEGLIRTVAGTSMAGFNGDGLATQTQLNAPNGLYTLPNGTTYILDLGNSLIRRLSTDGQLTTVFQDPDGIAFGRGLWVSPDEQTLFYASGTEVRRWSQQQGASVYATGFVELGNMDVDPRDGQLVVADREGHRVYKVFPDGSKQILAGNGDTRGGGSGFPATQTGLKEVRGIYFHPMGGYFLATHDGGQVWFVDDEQTIHLLIDGDDDGTHAGDGLPLTAPGRKVSEPRAVTLSQAGDLLVTEHDAGFIRRARRKNDLATAGDYDADGSLTVADIDGLSRAVRWQRQVVMFDLTSDDRLDQQDRRRWVEQLRRTWFGDADLDGQFNSRDFLHVFQAGEYEDALSSNSTWETGDWDGDGDFSSADFLIAFQGGGYEQGPRESTAAVPEPTIFSWFLAVVVSLIALARRS